MKSILKVFSITSIILATGSSAFAQISDHAQNARVKAGVGYWGTPSSQKQETQETPVAPTNLKITLVGTPDVNGDSYTFSAKVTFTSGKQAKVCNIVDAQMDFGDSKRLCSDGEYYIVIAVGGDAKVTNLTAKIYHDENIVFSDPVVASNSVKIGNGLSGSSASKEHVKTYAEMKAEGL